MIQSRVDETPLNAQTGGLVITSNGREVDNSMKLPVCPNCAREFAKRVRPQGIAEHLSALFYVYPFKCQLCGQRFKFFQWGVKYVKIPEDRRDYDRIPVNLPVFVSGENIDAKGTVSEISMGGCTLNVDADLSEGQILRLGLQISNDLLPVSVDVVVIRDVRMNCVGVEFLRFEQSDRDLLQVFIRGLLLGRGRPAEELFASDPAHSMPRPANILKQRS